MKKFTPALAIASLLATALAAGSGTVLAASREHGHEHGMPQHQTAAQPATHQATGVVKAINARDGKVQIAHEPVASLGWPAMTMWFVLRNPLPEGVEVGDTVRFEMVQGEKRQWEIVGISHR